MTGGRVPRGMGPLPAACVTALGLGLLRPAPGTWGSLLPVAVASSMLGTGCSINAITMVQVAIAVAFGIGCVAWGGLAERTLGAKDPSSVVADEVCAQALVLALLPWGFPLGNWTAIAVAFLAFRVADIVKPPPAGRLQSLSGGMGILADDIAAGGWALAAVWLIALASG